MRRIFILGILTLAMIAIAGESYAWDYTGLAEPFGVAVDSSGMIYVSCRNGATDVKDANGYVVRLNPDGTVENSKFIEGSASNPLSAPAGIIVIGDNIYVADVDSISIYETNKGKKKGEVIFEDILPKRIFGLSLGPDSALYATDGPANAIYKIDLNTNKASVFAQGDFLGEPHSLIWADSKQVFLVLGFASGNAVALDINGKTKVMPSIFLAGMQGSTFDLGGNIYISSEALKSVYRIDPSLVVEGMAPQVGAAQGLAWSKKGELLVVLLDSGSLKAVAPRQNQAPISLLPATTLQPPVPPPAEPSAQPPVGFSAK